MSKLRPVSQVGNMQDLWERGTSLVVQWLGLDTSTAGHVDSIPGGRTKLPYATWLGLPKNKQRLTGATCVSIMPLWGWMVWVEGARDRQDLSFSYMSIFYSIY